MLYLTRLFIFTFIPATFCAIATFASPINNEAEAGAVIVSGNKNIESYNAKVRSQYTEELNLYTVGGRYLKAISNGTESARNWELGGRYDREFSEKLGIFLGQKAESDIYNGYTQRDSTDLGLKYLITKEEKLTWKAEIGDRYQKVLATTNQVIYENLGRLYTEATKSWDKTVTLKFWVEYLPNFTKKEASLINTEASLNVMMTAVLSLKLGHLLQYQNSPLLVGKYTTTTSTLNLVAKF